MGNPFTHYSPAVNTVVVLALLLFAATVASIIRDRARLRHAVRAEQAEAAEREYWDGEQQKWLDEVAARDAAQAALGRKPAVCWVCDRDFYVPAEDPGDDRGRYCCNIGGCVEAA